MKYTCCLLLLCVFWSCGKQEMIKDVTAENLAEYITSNSENRLVRDSLIACALGGEVARRNAAQLILAKIQQFNRLCCMNKKGKEWALISTAAKPLFFRKLAYQWLSFY